MQIFKNIKLIIKKKKKKKKKKKFIKIEKNTRLYMYFPLKSSSSSPINWQFPYLEFWNLSSLAKDRDKIIVQDNFHSQNSIKYEQVLLVDVRTRWQTAVDHREWSKENKATCTQEDWRKERPNSEVYRVCEL